MRLVSYLDGECDRLAIFTNDQIYPLDELSDDLPDNMLDFLMEGDVVMRKALELQEKINYGKIHPKGIPADEVEITAPVPYPTSMRDAYAFRQHVSTARRNRGVDMIPEFDQFPVFYLTNHNAVYGPGPMEFMPDHFRKLDFELEVAIVIGKEGRNIRAEEADQHIGGYMIMNDYSARQMQMEEMKLNLGPAKGKDFATAIGPWLVTPDELKDRLKKPKEGHVGNAYDLRMTARVNGVEVSSGNLGDMDWTFAEIIERVSYGVDLLPGDIIGSGTVGTGCFLEINGTKRLDQPDYEDQWLKAGDTIELEVQGLGVLRNEILEEDTDYSILAKKKNV